MPLELIFEHRLYLPSFGIFLTMAMLIGMALRHGFSRLSEIDHAKVLCSILIVFASCTAILSFLRNEAWQDPITINYDCVTKAPRLPRANVDYGVALLRAGKYEQAIKYAEKGMALSSKTGPESYGLAANAIVSTLLEMGKYDEAVKRGEDFIANQPANIDGDAHPTLCLSMAQANMALDRYADAYKNVVQAFKYIEMTGKAMYKEEAACRVFNQLLERCRSREIDLNGDGIPDPGDMPTGLWMALEVDKLGDSSLSNQLLEQASAQNPDDIQVVQAIQKVKKEQAQNDMQRKKWDFSGKYVRRPFSRFNALMAVAFLVQERRMSKPFPKNRPAMP